MAMSYVYALLLLLMLMPGRLEWPGVQVVQYTYGGYACR